MTQKTYNLDLDPEMIKREFSKLNPQQIAFVTELNSRFSAGMPAGLVWADPDIRKLTVAGLESALGVRETRDEVEENAVNRLEEFVKALCEAFSPDISISMVLYTLELRTSLNFRYLHEAYGEYSGIEPDVAVTATKAGLAREGNLPSIDQIIKLCDGKKPS